MKNCPVFNTADLIGKKWTVVLIQEIFLNGDKGFNFLFKRMNKISPKILSKRLTELEEMHIIKKHTIDGTQTRTSYRLTTKGKELHQLLTKLKQWNMKHESSLIDCDTKECVTCSCY